MMAYKAFTNKEFLELVRTGKLIFVGILFLLFGVMNPAIAKLTPWLFSQVADSMAEQGITYTHIDVNVMTSWEQFYKNIPIVFIVFVLMFSGICTTEYQRQTLLNMLTKGLKRRTVILSKLTALCVVWTVGYWMSYVITYMYNIYFWKNDTVYHPFAAGAMAYLFGIWLATLIIFFSSWQSTNTGVSLGIGAVCICCYIAGMLPDIKKYVPMDLLAGLNLLSGIRTTGSYISSVLMTGILVIINIVISVFIFDRREVLD